VNFWFVDVLWLSFGDLIGVSVKKICVLLAAFNGERYIREQVSSISKQVDVELDLYIRLDRSDDNTESIIQGITDFKGNIYFFHSSSASGGAGQNFIRLMMETDFSTYDYIAFSDQDDIWIDDKLRNAVHQIESNGVDGYSSNVTAFWDDGSEKLITKSSPQVKFDYLFESAGPGCTFVMSNSLASAIKTFLLGKGDMIDTIWLHDWFCYAFARSKGFKWYIDSNSHMFYRQHSSNSVGANSGFKSLLKRAKSVVSGDAFNKVVNQAIFLGIEDMQPVKLIKTNTLTSLIKLLSLSHHCRRNNKEKVIFFIAIIISSLGKLFKCQK
jgi:rhamnosyltransferase